MSDSCCCPPGAGNEVCALPANDFERLAHILNACPECGRTGKAVKGQTVKTLLSVSLREVQDTQYLFCQTQTCRVVYFSADGEQTFTVQQVRERVYQKEPKAENVFICYCFHHTVGDLRAASSDKRNVLVEAIKTVINSEQCACDLRNPQGSCCLGNVRALITRLEKPAIALT